MNTIITQNKEKKDIYHIKLKQIINKTYQLVSNTS